MNIKKSDCSVKDNSYVIDASTAGLRPGQWPEIVTVLDEKNVGIRFQRGAADIVGDEVVGVRYHLLAGMNAVLLIVND